MTPALSAAQRARAAHPVLPTVAQTVRLKRQGTAWIGRCPWHGDRGRPNLAVFPATDTWHCFACGAHGDGLDWLARLQGTSLAAVIRADHPADPPRAVPVVPGEPGADVATRHRAYTALIHAGRLTAAHGAWLLARRMDPDRARQRGYVSVRPGPAPLDPGTDGIPGFYRVHGRWHLAGPAGLAIPVRDVAGHIQALHVRADDDGHGKYRWLSSPQRPGGASSGAPVHVARGAGTVVWVTEGPLKADVAARALGVPVLGVPGVSVWRRALPVLRTLRPARVVLAFDQDPVPTTAAAVAAQVDGFARACRARGWPVAVAHWDPACKGLDDALRVGASVDQGDMDGGSE